MPRYPSAHLPFPSGTSWLIFDAERRQDDAAFDAVVIRVDHLHALAGLLSLE